MTDDPIRFRFVRMGEVLEPRVGEIAVDVGSKCVPGVIDHHHRGGGEECAASLVATRPELVLDHLGEDRRLDTIVMHAWPDLDCVVSAYLVRQLARTGGLPVGAGALAEYTRIVDAGQAPPDSPFETSLWGLYTAAIHVLDPEPGALGEGDVENFRRWIERGFALVDAVLEEAPTGSTDVRLYSYVDGFDEERALLRSDWRRYREDLSRATVFPVELPRRDGTRRTVQGLRIRAPRALLFKHFARMEGHVFSHVIYPPADDGADDGRGNTRHVLSVDPESDVWLRGLGETLEAAEMQRRAATGDVRPGPARWADVTNADPWYDGRSPLHGFTIVDSPWHGTALGDDDVASVAARTDAWIALGESRRQRICPRCRAVGGPQQRFCPQDAEQLVPAVAGGRYEIGHTLGKGGMGIVYRVTDTRTLRPLALKVLLADLQPEPGRQRRFYREARLANSLDHPNLMRVVDLGADPTLGVYMACELLEGTTLKRDIQRQWLEVGHYPGPRIRAVLAQVCEGLSAMHEAGVVHRDLKPENIMLLPGETADPADVRVKLMDFGIALLVDDRISRLTATGMAIGTPAYCAPEQLLGRRDLTPRVDLYALGAIFYELIAGRAPFADSPSREALCYRKVTAPGPPSLSALDPAVDTPAGAEKLIRKLMANQPRKRPVSAAAAQRAIEALPLND